MSVLLAEVDLEAWGYFLAEHGLALLFIFAVLIGALLVWFRLAARPQPPLSRDLIGKPGTTLTAISSREGRVAVDGRALRAVAESRILAGAAVRVVDVDGLIAKVAPADG